MAVVIGTCALCLRSEQELQWSHMLPASIYRKLSDGSGRVVKMGRTTTILTSRQLQRHLLCIECEKLFNERGEAWVLPLLWNGPDDFGLRRLLAATQPAGAGTGLRVYAGRDVPMLEMDQLAYFAASVFWRCAAAIWRDGPDEHHIELGPYLEPLRLALQAAPFPDGMALATLLTGDDRAASNMMVQAPSLRGRSTGYRRFQFDVPGVRFLLFVGNDLPPEVIRTCTARTGVISEVSDLERWRTEDVYILLKTTSRRGQLATK